MFDLHMHTTLSDGKLGVDELLALLQSEHIKLFSITDHNHCLSYQHFDSSKFPVLVGTEIATSYQGRIIEILGYGVNYEMINTWYQSFFSETELRKKELFLFNRLKKIIAKEKLDLTVDLKLPNFEKGISKRTIYEDLVKRNPQFTTEFPSYKSFFRNGLSNPESAYFLNEALTYPSFQEVVNLIHDAGGKAFLAHPYEYGLENLDQLLDYCNQQLDGIECFHPSASFIQSIALFNYCEKHQLNACGGSDFHKFERQVRVGVRVLDNFYDRQPFAWLREYISKEQFR